MHHFTLLAYIQDGPELALFGYDAVKRCYVTADGHLFQVGVELEQQLLDFSAAVVTVFEFMVRKTLSDKLLGSVRDR